MISVIIPVYNVKDYIKKCLDSLIAQTYRDYECLVIDDGSKDDSIKIAYELIKDDERFVIYHKENGGLADARNFGLRRAKGDYILFLDSDDHLDPKTLELSIESAERYDSDIVTFDMIYHYQDRDEKIISNEKEVTSFKEDRSLIYINNSANNKLFRRSLLKDEAFIKGMWYEDLAVVPVWLKKAEVVSHVHECLYYYRQREGSISKSEDERIFDIYKAIANIRKELDLSDELIAPFYIEHALTLITLKIAKFKDKKVRIRYLKENMDNLDKEFKSWPRYAKTKDKKRKIMYLLLRLGAFDLLDRMLDHS